MGLFSLHGTCDMAQITPYIYTHVCNNGALVTQRHKESSICHPISTHAEEHSV